MDWTGQQSEEGCKFHVPVIAMRATLVMIGAGKWALDGVMYRVYETRSRAQQQRTMKAA